MKNFEIAINIRLLFPEAHIELDNDGQIIIYTGEYESVQPLGEPNSRTLEW